MTNCKKRNGSFPASLRYAVNGISNTRPETAEKIAKALKIDLSEIIA